MLEVLAHGQAVAGHPLLAELARVVHVHEAGIAVLLFVLVNGDLMNGMGWLGTYWYIITFKTIFCYSEISVKQAVAEIRVARNQCCGSGSVCFWASGIRIH